MRANPAVLLSLPYNALVDHTRHHTRRGLRSEPNSTLQQICVRKNSVNRGVRTVPSAQELHTIAVNLIGVDDYVVFGTWPAQETKCFMFVLTRAWATQDCAIIVLRRVHQSLLSLASWSYKSISIYLHLNMTGAPVCHIRRSSTNSANLQWAKLPSDLRSEARAFQRQSRKVDWLDLGSGRTMVVDTVESTWSKGEGLGGGSGVSGVYTLNVTTKSSLDTNLLSR